MPVEHVDALAAGARLNQYELMQILGSGGFGITYMARDTTLDTLVAIKEYMPGELATRLGKSTVTARSSTSQGDFDWGLKRFLEEARVLAKFRHPAIVRVNQIFEANNTAYLVMEYAKGETLDARLRRTGPIGEQETKDILLPILDGLKRVHELGFLHRDIKPGNIIVRDEGGSVLIDFGAAREATGSKTRAITSIVTEGYAPLEQYDVTGNQGAWTDIYALGGVAYKCLTGQKPPSATSRVRTDPLVPLGVAAQGRISPAFAAAVDASLKLHDNERPQNIGQLLALMSGAAPAPVADDATVAVGLDATRAISPTVTKPDVTAKSVAAPVQSVPVRKRRGAYLAVAAAALLIAAGGGWFYAQRVAPQASVKEESRVAEAPPAPAPIPAPAPASPPSAAIITPAPPISPPPPPAVAPRPQAPPAAASAPEPPKPAPAPPSPIPSLPATPAKAAAMLKGFSDPVLKAVLAQPGLRGRVETLLGLGGCDWRVNANAAGQAAARQAGAYLNTMDDDALQETLGSGALLDRIDVLFGRGSCTVTQQTGSAASGFPQQDTSGGIVP